jgi:hypothetical protein
MKVLTTLIALLFVATTSFAQEVPTPKPMLIRNGVLCNTKHDLQVLLTGISLNNGQFPEEVPDGCGMFSPEQPVPMLVTPLEWYETPMANTLIAHFLYLPNSWQQYGWIAYTPNPDWKPSNPA